MTAKNKRWKTDKKTSEKGVERESTIVDRQHRRRSSSFMIIWETTMGQKGAQTLG
jgi:hypothetical protein